MHQQLLSNFYIVKMAEKYYVFSVRVVLGGVMYSCISDAFHTETAAHLFLIEKAKEEGKMMGNMSFQCVEVLKQYAFIGSGPSPVPPRLDS